METTLFTLAALTLLVHVVVTADGVWGARRLRRLADVDPEDSAHGPLAPLSVVVAARNEERHVEASLRALLAQDHPDLEVVAVDDRSTDATSAILARLAAAEPRLTVVRVDELPAGWLGKTHALQRGAERARGELLLFADADVLLERTAVRRAARHMQREGLDHLTVGPRVDAPSPTVEALVGGFSVFFALWARPWKARDPESPQAVGIGAFNLVRATSWRAAGTHAAIRMRIDDDMMLGRILKREGRRQELLLGEELVRLEWYANTRELVRGLSKSTFAGVEFRPGVVVAGTLVMALLHLWPWLATVLTGGWTRALNAWCVGLMGLDYLAANRASGVRPRFLVAFPLATLVLVYVQWRSMLLALWRGHVEWRGTRYPLDELRAARV